MTIVVYGHTRIVCFVWFCLFIVFMQYFKSLSVFLVSLPLDAVGFCDSSLWSYTFSCFCMFCLSVLFMRHKKVCLCLLLLCVRSISSQTLMFYAKSEQLISIYNELNNLNFFLSLKLNSVCGKVVHKEAKYCFMDQTKIDYYVVLNFNL